GVEIGEAATAVAVEDADVAVVDAGGAAGVNAGDGGAPDKVHPPVVVEVGGHQVVGVARLQAPGERGRRAEGPRACAGDEEDVGISGHGRLLDPAHLAGVRAADDVEHAVAVDVGDVDAACLEADVAEHRGRLVAATGDAEVERDG